MSASLHRVSLVGTGSFLPNAPVPSERIDDVLGPLTAAPLRVQAFVETVGRRMLDQGGVQSRHFAVDPETRRLTHTAATLAEAAARRALEAAAARPADVELLLLSSPSYDQTTPPTSTTLQERLGIERCAEMEVHSNCAGVGKSVQIAFDALRLGRYRTALVVYSQLSSVYLRSCYFNPHKISKNQAALRYILADGAGAVVLRAEPDRGEPAAHEVLGTYVESVGGSRLPGMTAGGGVSDLIEWGDPVASVYERGGHHLDQDFAAVNRHAGPLLLEGVSRLLDTLRLAPGQIDHFVLSIPTMQLYNDNRARFADRLGVIEERMKFRSAHAGYTGGAAILLHLDEMVRSGELRPGQTVLLHSVESSKWMTAGFVVRW
jgi:3-oxoacyl-[acyl-carrier-protein] synthase-3